MKKNTNELGEIKEKILNLKGFPIKMAVNQGRKKIVEINCKIVNVYPSVFTIESEMPNTVGNKTFSYFDVLCGDVRILDK